MRDCDGLWGCACMLCLWLQCCVVWCPHCARSGSHACARTHIPAQASAHIRSHAGLCTGTCTGACACALARKHACSRKHTHTRTRRGRYALWEGDRHGGQKIGESVRIRIGTHTSACVFGAMVPACVRRCTFAHLTQAPADALIWAAELQREGQPDHGHFLAQWCTAGGRRCRDLLLPALLRNQCTSHTHSNRRLRCGQDCFYRPAGNRHPRSEYLILAPGP